MMTEQQRTARSTLAIVTLSSFAEALLGLYCLIFPESVQKVFPNLDLGDAKYIGWLLIIFGIGSMAVFLSITRKMDRK